jgi:hypothetical protein
MNVELAVPLLAGHRRGGRPRSVAFALVPIARAPRRRAGLGLRVGLAIVARSSGLWPAALLPAASGPAEGRRRGRVAHLLNLLIGLPIVGAVAVLFMPRQMLLGCSAASRSG